MQIFFILSLEVEKKSDWKIAQSIWMIDKLFKDIIFEQLFKCEDIMKII